MLIVLDNYAVYLEELDFFEESLEKCQREMKLEFSCRRGGEIAGTLMNIACVYERQKIKLEEQKRLYWQAYYISNLMGNEALEEIIRKCFGILYGEKVEIYKE